MVLDIRRHAMWWALAACGLGVLITACEASDSAGASMEADDDWGGSADADADMDGDADTDADSDSDGPPEEEEEVDYRVPQGSGRYVFIADETHDAVVVIDSDSLAINVAEVGNHPTHLVPLANDNAAAVINIDSDEVTLLRVDDSTAEVSTFELDVRPDTNALAVSADGRYVIAFYDALFAEESGPPGTDQEISVIDTTEGAEEVYDLSVGMHPERVVYNDEATRAFVVTADGVSVIDLESLDAVESPVELSFYDDAVVDPADVEIAITPSGDLALARAEGEAEVLAAWTDDSEELRSYLLPASPTDLDISPDGSFGLFTMRSLSQVAFFDLPLPDDAAADPFTYFDLGDVICGVATIAPDGDKVLLHTTTAGEVDDRRLLTLLTREGDGWVDEHAMLEREIKSVAAGTASEAAVVIHEEIAASYDEHPFSYTLVRLPELTRKFQQIPVQPGQLLLTPDGDFGYLLLRGDALSIKRTEVINLATFIVDSLELGSPPTAAGYAESTDKVFVAQEHPAGRMTFIGVHDDSIKTVTGYALNDEISD